MKQSCLSGIWFLSMTADLCSGNKWLDGHAVGNGGSAQGDMREEAPCRHYYCIQPKLYCGNVIIYFYPCTYVIFYHMCQLSGEQLLLMINPLYLMYFETMLSGEYIDQLT